jgi:signal transduction histidine kinase
VDVAEYLTDQRAHITERWRAAVAKLPELASLPPPGIVDHLPEFLYELARWMTGDDEAETRAYVHLVQGHALQRLGHGVHLKTLLTEYHLLRQVVLDETLAHVSHDRAGILGLNRALDLAISESVRQYTAQRDEIRDRFVSILGHDLRNPLQALVLGAENIIATPCTQASHGRFAAAIRRGGDRMARMVADLGDFALGQLGGGIPATPQTCDMAEIARVAVDELRAAHPDRLLELDAPTPVIGSWDRDRCVQVMSNLVGNALVHGEDPIRVRVHEERDRNHVITEINNGGPPIPADTVDKLFDPFRRGARAKRGGLGLGLYIVRQIVLAHGGDIEVESTAQGGTTFRIMWPRAPLDEVPRPYQEDLAKKTT